MTTRAPSGLNAADDDHVLMPFEHDEGGSGPSAPDPRRFVPGER